MDDQNVMANKGWYTHGCGQWVHDKFAPCSVYNPKRVQKAHRNIHRLKPKKPAFSVRHGQKDDL